MNWHLQDAKNNFSKVVQKAVTDGPQTVTVRGKRTALIISADEYDRLVADGEKMSLAAFLTSGAAWTDEMVAEVDRRSPLPPREIEL